MTKKEAVRIVEESIHRHPEIKAIGRKERIIEEKHAIPAGYNGYHFCPECSTWTPEEPPELAPLYKEWDKVFAREVEKVRKMKSAA